LDSLKSSGPDPQAQLLANESRAHLTQAVMGLKEKYRVVLLLREVDGMSYDEITGALGIPQGTVESRLHRARAQLQKILRKRAAREAKS
jgi:RNA polymerase sigma-70 factor (ECF subfamily)